MPQTDLLLTDDMEEGLDLNFIRFNEAKKEHGDANHRRLVISASTFGGGTQSLALAADNVSEFYRRIVFSLTGASTGPWTLQVETAERIFYVDNQCGQTVTIDTTAGASTAVTLPTDTKVQLYESATGDFIILDSHEVSTAAAQRPFDVAAFLPGFYSNSQIILKFVYPRQVSIGDDFPLSQAHQGTRVASNKTFDVHRNGSDIGNIAFTTASDFGTFTSSTSYTFSAGDVLEIIAPTSTDSAGQDFSFTIAGLRP